MKHWGLALGSTSFLAKALPLSVETEGDEVGEAVCAYVKCVWGGWVASRKQFT